MSTLRRAALLVLLLAVGPAGAGEFTCPDKGGAPWREVSTAHFAVQTDLDAGAARELARGVERLYEALRLAFAIPPQESPGRLRVVPMRGYEFDLFADKNVGGFYMSSSDLGPVIVLPEQFGKEQRITVAHELTHHLLARALARQPRWFKEGMACYMETLGTDVMEQTPSIGGVNPWRRRAVFPYHGGMAQVLTTSGQLDERGYGMAWALVHFLINKRKAEFGKLTNRFAVGQDPNAAWRDIFPEWDPATPAGGAALDDAVGRYLKSGSFGYREIKLPPESAVKERPLTASDVHAIRLSLPWWNRGEPAAVGAEFGAEVDEALVHDPGNVVALRILARRKENEGKRLDLAEKAVAVHPESSLAWLFLASSLPMEAGPRRLEASAKASQLAPTDATAANNYAWELLAAGRSGEALPLARQAVALEPSSSAALDTLAGVLADLGRCHDALGVQHRAVDMLPERASDAERRPYLKRLDQLVKECVKPEPVRAAPSDGG